MKKRLLVCLLMVVLAVSLCACGGDGQSETAPTPTPTAAPTPTPEIIKEIMTDSYTAALDYVDCQVTDLYAAIGEPTDSSYAPSCLGPGQDGELYYDGFTVHTYREGDSEIVRVVLK